MVQADIAQISSQMISATIVTPIEIPPFSLSICIAGYVDDFAQHSTTFVRRNR